MLTGTECSRRRGANGHRKQVAFSPIEIRKAADVAEYFAAVIQSTLKRHQNQRENQAGQRTGTKRNRAR
jgi:hypothetical protein